MELDAEELRAAIGDFVRRVRVHAEMPPGQAAALGHLDRTGPLSIAELARLERVKHQSMTRTVGLLSEQGWVTLAPHEQDRRQVVVTATAAGRAVLNDERDARAALIDRALRASLTAEELAVLARVPAILRKVTV
jgi:DNA-binding MarR family transcriptional regulator